MRWMGFSRLRRIFVAGLVAASCTAGVALTHAQGPGESAPAGPAYASETTSGPNDPSQVGPVASIPSGQFQGTPAVAEHPLVPALRMAYSGMDTINKNIPDYTCLLVKRERIDGKLGEHQYMDVKIRNHPFSVYLNFRMPAEAVQQQMIFYICPRPVVLVSVDDDSHSNLFPMDLIGPVSSDRFTLALRSTSPSIATMKSARRVVLSDVPARDYATAYKLGIHHKKKMVDWDHLPFEIQRSSNFSLPYPSIALRVREIEILDFDTVGSHTLFVTRIESEHSAEDDAQFFHTSGIYQHFRSCNGRPFPPAS